jgi:hypothetical protein
MTDDDESFAIADDLPLLERDAFERLAAEQPGLSLWPCALEFEDEGDIPSEIAPTRRLLHGAYESILTIRHSPLGRDGEFDAEPVDAQRRIYAPRRYRVVGRMPGSRFDWLIVARVPKTAATPKPRPARARGRAKKAGRR